MNNLDMAIEYAYCLLGSPYRWGGNGPYFDCSGFVQEVLASVGLDPRGDQTAQKLHDYMKVHSEETSQKGSLLFYGASRDTITHVALCVSDEFMIEAGGGDSTTTTLRRAMQQGAMVRLRPIRRNHVCALLPVY